MSGGDAPGPGAGSLRVRSLHALANESDLTVPGGRVHHVHSLAPGQVALPSLPVGATFLEAWPVHEQPDGTSWRAPFYTCMAPATFVLRDAVLHASAGIVALDDMVLAETLAHTVPEAARYTATDGRVRLHDAALAGRLSGTCISILAGGQGNYFHALIESLARVAMLPPHLLGKARALLYPHGSAVHAQVLPLLGLPQSLVPIPVRNEDSFVVDRLVWPWSVHGAAEYHPCVGTFFDTIAGNVAATGRSFPERIYLDRTGTALRPLLNEAAVATRLAAYGFVPIRPETLTFADQVRLFRGARAVVAPHGAGLTNIGFCRPGCAVLELHMDAYVNWCFRHLAALRGLSYDCVLGRSIAPWADVASGAVHALSWRISEDHVVAAAARMPD